MLGSGMTSVSPNGRYVRHQEKMYGLRFATCLRLVKDQPDCIREGKFDGSNNRVVVSTPEGCLFRMNLEESAYMELSTCHITHYYCYSEASNRMLAATWCRGLSRLLSISHNHKREESISNLNMNKLNSFDVNVLRDLILVSDSGLLALLDIKSKKQYRTRKPQKEKFLRSCFTADGKGVLLINNQMKVYVLHLATLEERWSVQLPLVFSQPQLHVSYDGRWAIVTGGFNGMYMLELQTDRAPIISRIQLPTQVKQGKFTLEGDFVFVGRDQVVYHFSLKDNPDKIYALFNTELHKPINSFDISVDLKSLVCFGNYGFVYVFNFKDALKALKSKSVQFVQLPIFWINDAVAKEVDYNPLDKSFEEERPESPNKLPSGKNTLDAKSTNKEYKDFEGIPDLQPRYVYNPDPDRPITHVPQEVPERDDIYRNFYVLKNTLNRESYFEDYSKEIVQVVYAFIKMFPPERQNHRKSLSIAGYFIAWTMRMNDRVRELSLALCPGVMAIITRKQGIEFEEFISQAMASLYIDYFNRDDWLRIIKFFIHNQQRESVLLVFFLNVLLHLQNRIRQCENEVALFQMLTSEKDLDLSRIMEETLDLYDVKKYRDLLANQPAQQKITSSAIIRRQQVHLQQQKEGLAEYSDQSDGDEQFEKQLPQESVQPPQPPVYANRLQQLLYENSKLKNALGDISSRRYNLQGTFN